MTKIVHVVGARPNFVKMAPVVDALSGHRWLRQVIVHTGQHYDEQLSGEMLSNLELPPPDRFLGVGSGRHGEQTARALVACEGVLLEEQPDMLVVGGDVNSTLAAALAAAKLGIPVAHVEAGLRSRDWSMPEEVNRVLTDRLSDLLFTHSPEAETNLLAEGIDAGRIHAVGNTMIDSLRRFEPTARERATWRRWDLSERGFVLVTLHRPSNVDRGDRLEGIVTALSALAQRVPVLFPVHPRTRARLEAGNQLERLQAAGAICLDPLPYLDFLSLELGALAVVTDSGGVQEETSALGVRCYTLRPNTERPVTISHGTNSLLGDHPAAIADIELPAYPPTPAAIPLWDGHAGERTASVLLGAVAAAEALEQTGT